MSHIVQIQTEVRDYAAVSAACRRLQLPLLIAGTAQLFSGEVSGLIVRLPDWAYPAVIDTTTGQVHYDNFNGAWGDQAQLGHASRPAKRATRSPSRPWPTAPSS